MEWMLLPLKRYAEFSGRSRRKEYWMFVPFTIIMSIVLGVLDTLLGLKFGNSMGSTGAFRSGNGVLGSIFSLVTFVPALAVGVRRLHDTDRTGWWLVAPVVLVIVGVLGAILLAGTGGGGIVGTVTIAIVAALVSGIVLLVFFCLDGTRGANRFGPDPKGRELQDVFA